MPTTTYSSQLMLFFMPNAPHHCLLRTGRDRDSPCPAGRYQHSRTGRYLVPEPILRPQEMGPKRGASQRVPMALPIGARLSTNCRHPTIRLYQGTLPKAPGPADNKPCGPRRPHVAAPGTAWRQGRSPGNPMLLSQSVSPNRTVLALLEENILNRLHQPLRCMTRASGARPAVIMYVLCLQALTARFVQAEGSAPQAFASCVRYRMSLNYETYAIATRDGAT